MATTEITHQVDEHFAGKAPVARAIYDRLLNGVGAFGPVVEEAKKTSIHLTNRTAFAGVQVQKQAILLTIKAAAPLTSPRIRKTKQVSANRVHQIVKLETPDDVDDELLGWLAAAYQLST